MQTIMLPHAGIVLMVGPSSSGKTTLLRHLIDKGIIKPTEVISSDQFRLLISDKEFVDWRNRPSDEADILFEEFQLISQEAFAALEYVLGTRCKLNKLTIVDATHLHNDDRKRYVQIARQLNVPIVAIALHISEQTLLTWDKSRENPRGKRRIQQQYRTFTRQLRSLKKEGFSAQYVVKEDELPSLSFGRKKNRFVLDVESGIDVIGDIHGCFDELLELLSKLGYRKNLDGYYVHPEGRRFLSVGDVMSRGPRSLDTMQLFQKHIVAGLAYMIDSNHGWKIARWLDGRKVQLQHGDELLAKEFVRYEQEHGEQEALQLKELLREMLLKAPSHYIIQQHHVNVAVVAHAGIRDEYIGKHSPAISDFCRYGDTAGFDEAGKPIRREWYQQHKTKEWIIWGHDPKPEPLMISRTINIDQGVVFGGKLTALRFPEKQFVTVQAKENYSGVEDNPLRKWEVNRLAPPDLLAFLEGYQVTTEELGEVKVKAPFVKSAIDDISHFTLPIEDLVYIPPTMSPPSLTSKLSNYLEHPLEAFEYYQKNGVQIMVAEKKHMGSRGILLLFKDRQVAKRKIGREMLGAIYTRTGRRFFTTELEQSILSKLNTDLQSYFAEEQTDFVLLDAEIMPWNLKAKELIQNQYAHVGTMAELDRLFRRDKLLQALQTGANVGDWVSEADRQLEHAKIFQSVYPKYAWDTDGLTGIQIAPFHTLAHSDRTFFDQTHLWHMEKNKQLSLLSDLFVETEYQVIHDEMSMHKAVSWWEEMTDLGHEGFVVKPLSFIARNEQSKLLQPAIKVRGAKYLHIIYGIDYLEPQNLERLKQRNTGRKGRKALQEFALGLEGIQRFVNGESLARIHECVLATLAMEADAVDPRL